MRSFIHFVLFSFVLLSLLGIHFAREFEAHREMNSDISSTHSKYKVSMDACGKATGSWDSSSIYTGMRYDRGLSNNSTPVPIVLRLFAHSLRTQGCDLKLWRGVAWFVWNPLFASAVFLTGEQCSGIVEFVYTIIWLNNRTNWLLGYRF